MTDESIRETKTIRLIDPLPCSIWAPGNAPCGKPAFVAFAWPSTQQTEWPLPGLWTLQPVCADCTASMMQKGDSTHDDR